MDAVPWAAHPLPPLDPQILAVSTVLDPVLAPLGFAPGQGGASDRTGQVIFCRGFVDSDDGGCIDLVVELEAAPAWRVTGVRYWGFPEDRWRLPFLHHADLADQLADLARTLPEILS